MVYKYKDGVRLIRTDKVAYFEDTISLEKFEIAGAAIVFAELIDGERSMDEIFNELINIFGRSVEPYILSRDLEGFIFDLLDSGLIVPVKFEQPKGDFFGMQYPGNIGNKNNVQ